MNRTVHHKRTSCRVCGGRNLHAFLSLGPTPLANSFLHNPEEFGEELSFPLDVYFCSDCSLVQLLDVIDPETLFRNYIYVTGTSDTIQSHNREYADRVVDFLQLTSSDLVVEIASNDGSLLKCFQKYQVRTLGVEPAINIASLAIQAGVETISQFFNLGTANEVKNEFGQAKVVIGNNVLAHVDDPVDFLTGCCQLITADGMVIIEVPYLEQLLINLEYDTIYHEHLSYFSVTALKRLFEEAGLRIVRIDRVAVHGGSIRVYAGKPPAHPHHGNAISDFLTREEEMGISSLSLYEGFARQVADNRQKILALITQISAQGKTVVGYGASAKGNTLLNYCTIGVESLGYIVDKNPWKIGTYTPGMHIPVKTVDTLLNEQPDYVFLLAWNFASEIMYQQAEYARQGGQFIIPLPEPGVIKL
jgi:hypothetical protein